MSQRLRNLTFAAAGLLTFGIAASLWLLDRSGALDGGSDPLEGAAPKPELGLMTSLPLYWPLGADMTAMLDSEAEPPWQRAILEARYDLRLLDSLAPNDRGMTPLAGLERVAIIQPRGLSPEGNVALDDWVRAGGHLLIVLDPALTGEYELPLADPRRPSASALIPPVIERWGLVISFDEDQGMTVREDALGDLSLPLLLAGELQASEGRAEHDCTISVSAAAARCKVGDGQVTLLADAAMFEHRELAGSEGMKLISLLGAAFERVAAP